MKSKYLRIFSLIMGIVNVVAFAIFLVLVVSTLIKGEGFIGLAESIIGSLAVLIFLALNSVVCFLNYAKKNNKN